jgi:hypothetical protein
MSAGHPLQANQQQYVVVGGVRYDWDPYAGQYLDASARSVTGQQYHRLQPNQQPSIGGYTWDYATGQYKDAQGHVLGQPAQQPAPAAPDPYQGWLSSNAGSRSYRYFAPDLQQYYEQHPDEAARQYFDSQFGTRDTPIANYARSNYDRYWSDYIRASETNPNMHFTDYLTNNLAGQIRNSFNLQSPTQKGYSLVWQPAGRNTF